METIETALLILGMGSLLVKFYKLIEQSRNLNFEYQKNKDFD